MNYQTIGNLLDACAECKTQAEANGVLRRAKEDNPEYAEQNIGYILGYLSPNERERLYSLFSKCNHPIFGSSFGRGKDPSPEEVFEMGRKMGDSLK